jgi:hypothetical protein
MEAVSVIAPPDWAAGYFCHDRFSPSNGVMPLVEGALQRGEATQFWFRYHVTSQYVEVDDWLKGLKVNNKTICLVALRLALECHDFAASRGISHHSIEDQLGFVLRELDGNVCHLIDIIPVVAGDASRLSLCIQLSFSGVGYRRMAEAAKNRVTGSID